MDNPTGKIHSLVADNDGVRAIVEVDVGQSCPRCAAGKGCGAGLFAGDNRMRRVEAMVSEHLTLAKGDDVEISLASSNLLVAALIVYGIPLFGAISAAAIAYLFQLGDAAAASAALLGLVAGLLVGRWSLSRKECLANFVPYIEKRLNVQNPGL
jgi:sigma-E factor negative regulatory protein RseC